MTSLPESRAGRPTSSATDKGRPGTSNERPGTSGSTSSVQPKKKSLLSSMFAKKDKENVSHASTGQQAGPQTVQLEAMKTAHSKPKKKNRDLNRKNIADGRALMEVKPADLVPPDYVVDYRDNPYDVFESVPLRTTSYIESLKNGQFYIVYNTALRGIMEKQKEAKNLTLIHSSDQTHDEMVDNIKNRQVILDKFFILIQGIYAGMSILQILIVFLGDSKISTIVNYLVPSLRLSQTLLILALLSAIGCLDKLFTSRRIYNQMRRNQSGNMQKLKNMQVRSAIAVISFALSYCLTIYNHEVNSIISNNSTNVNKMIDLLGGSDLVKFTVYQVITVIIGVASVFGWIMVVSVQGSSEISEADQTLQHYDHLRTEADEHSTRIGIAP